MKCFRMSLLIIVVMLSVARADQLDCSELDNGQSSNNPVYKETECSNKCFSCQPKHCKSYEHSSSCLPTAYSDSENDDITKCNVDGYVGSYVIMEDDFVRVWNFTLEPGQMTSMHRHDYDYAFVAVKPSQLEVYGEDGKRLFDFWATGLSLRVDGDYLEPTGNTTLPWKVPRIHAARNIGPNTYHEILFENKYSTGNFVTQLVTKEEL